MQEFLKQKAGAFASWLGGWCKDNIDFALILAVCTETPRWTVTFMAIHEPLWIGVSLGVLLAFATSKVWRHYFVTRSRTTLIFNVLAIILAVGVISPVLYAMTENEPGQINIADVLQGWQVRAIWSVALALTTFVPLVQLAAVHGAQPQKDKPQQRTAQSKSKDVQLDTAQIGVDDSQNVQVENAQLTQDDDTIDKRQRAIQLRSEDLSYAQIAEELGVHRNTVANWLKTANGYTKAVQS